VHLLSRVHGQPFANYRNIKTQETVKSRAFIWAARERLRPRVLRSLRMIGTFFLAKKIFSGRIIY